ncbi:MAG TPA: UvrD-helicase domain-containing protein, partial [Solirubrobacterales bacterium]|nr:UvrD-helicase domain-containing protein [Solirubrobacterales bacterium]
MLALAEPQALAVAHDEGPLLVVGAAGTGKTEVLARRLARLAAEGTGPEQVLVLASTRATARRLRERAEVLLEGPY